MSTFVLRLKQTTIPFIKAHYEIAINAAPTCHVYLHARWQKIIQVGLHCSLGAYQTSYIITKTSLERTTEGLVLIVTGTHAIGLLKHHTNRICYYQQDTKARLSHLLSVLPEPPDVIFHIPHQPAPPFIFQSEHDSFWTHLNATIAAHKTCWSVDTQRFHVGPLNGDTHPFPTHYDGLSGQPGRTVTATIPDQWSWQLFDRLKGAPLCPDARISALCTTFDGMLQRIETTVTLSTDLPLPITPRLTHDTLMLNPAPLIQDSPLDGTGHQYLQWSSTIVGDWRTTAFPSCSPHATRDYAKQTPPQRGQLAVVGLSETAQPMILGMLPTSHTKQASTTTPSYVWSTRFGLSLHWSDDVHAPVTTLRHPNAAYIQLATETGCTLKAHTTQFNMQSNWCWASPTVTQTTTTLNWHQSTLKLKAETLSQTSNTVMRQSDTQTIQAEQSYWCAWEQLAIQSNAVVWAAQQVHWWGKKTAVEAQHINIKAEQSIRLRVGTTSIWMTPHQIHMHASMLKLRAQTPIKLPRKPMIKPYKRLAGAPACEVSLDTKTKEQDSTEATENPLQIKDYYSEHQ